MMGSLAVLEMCRISSVSSRICSTMPVLLSLLRGICACHCRLHAVPFGPCCRASTIWWRLQEEHTINMQVPPCCSVGRADEALAAAASAEQLGSQAAPAAAAASKGRGGGSKSRRKG
jgi:hypothetical protein